jgi:hypothetical protein
MDDWFKSIASDHELPQEMAAKLEDVGFALIPGLPPEEKLAQLVAAYDAAVSSAIPADVSIGSSTTRVSDFVNRGPAFDDLYLCGPLLAASGRVIGQPFKLSTMHARTVHPNSAAQALRIDFPRDSAGWPITGFIVMVDKFREDNGATRFVPGSHRWATDLLNDMHVSNEQQVMACGPAGSMIIYNGAVWHGHAANLTDQPRRSIQGAYIRREAEGWIQRNARMLPETMSRISPLAKYLLAV